MDKIHIYFYKEQVNLFILYVSSLKWITENKTNASSHVLLFTIIIKALLLLKVVYFILNNVVYDKIAVKRLIGPSFRPNFSDISLHLMITHEAPTTVAAEYRFCEIFCYF